LVSIDFALNGSYSAYNWELFFHAPLMVAERLTQNQNGDILDCSMAIEYTLQISANEGCSCDRVTA